MLTKKAKLAESNVRKYNDRKQRLSDTFSEQDKSDIISVTSMMSLLSKQNNKISKNDQNVKSVMQFYMESMNLSKIQRKRDASLKRKYYKLGLTEKSIKYREY